MLHLLNCKVSNFRTKWRNVTSTTTIIVKSNVCGAAYQPRLVEKNRYESWESQDLFTAQIPSSKPSFGMVLPPPNVTGNLHLGHALTATIQDVIVRHRRSMGDNVLWLPGMDHAGIATQGVVEKYLKTKQDINRFDLGREKFINEVWKWKDRHGDTIYKQLKTLGCSLDWSLQTFTMNPKHSHAVETAFINLFKRGLIYRKKALVNWCSTLKSTVSDIEVENITINGPKEINVPGYFTPVKFGLMYYFTYRVYDSDKVIMVATTTPETMLGDTAIAVHPDDERYKGLKDARVWHPFRNTTIPIIFDDFVDMKLGTGAVKVTPAHSKIDYNVAKLHNLPLYEVINEEGRMKNSERFNDMKRYDCRDAVVKYLEQMGLMQSIKPHHMTIPICGRTGNVIDHLPKEQWFLYCSELNKKAADAVKNGKLTIEPSNFVQNWLNWTGDNRDWCISRQLWWGHQIPAYKCSVDRNIVWVAAPNEAAARTEASKHLRTLPDLVKAERDTDVLDTWFSSGIYPFAALGWPDTNQHKEFSQYYPLSLLATGHDILGFWVHRMVILGLELTGELPFKKVLLHGVICDGKGAKMSKSRGNVIDPMDVVHGISLENLKDKTKEMHRHGILNTTEFDKALAYHQTNFTNTNGIPECGADALRFTLLSHDIKSHFVNFDIAMCHANKLFCNKIWQSVKYAQLAYAKLDPLTDDITSDDLTYFDKWILSKMVDMVEKVNGSIEKYEFHLATKAIKSFIHNQFCDVYLEATKPAFERNDIQMAHAHAHTLAAVLNTALRCLAPFMVYLTDELVTKVPAFSDNIIYNYKDDKNKYLDFPQNDDFQKWKDDDIEKQVYRFLTTVNLVREIKGLYNISNKLKPSVYLRSTDSNLKSDIEDNETVFLNLTRCSDVTFQKHPNTNYVTGVLDKNTEVHVELHGEDVEIAVFAAKTKLEKRIKRLEDSLSKLEAKFQSGYYLANAPEWAQLHDKERLQNKKKELEGLQRLM